MSYSLYNWSCTFALDGETHHFRMTSVPNEVETRQHAQRIIDTYEWAKERKIVELVRVHSPAELKEKVDAAKQKQIDGKYPTLQEKQEAFAGVHADEEAAGE